MMKTSKIIFDSKKYLSNTEKNKMKNLNGSKVKITILVWAILSVMFVSSNALGTIVMSTDVLKAIPDNNPTGISSSLTFPSMLIGDVDLILTITHNSLPDLHIELQSPQGTIATLLLAYNENGILKGIGFPDNFTDTVFDDEASTSLRDGSAPYTDHFNITWPGSNNLSLFDGEDAGGTWTLFVSDRTAFDTGTLDEWGLEITPVPEPATVMLLGLGAMALLKMPQRKS